jgi:hypothetical protein
MAEIIPFPRKRGPALSGPRLLPVTAASVVALTLPLMPLPALAQMDNPQAQAPSGVQAEGPVAARPMLDPNTLSDEELNAYADAVINVGEVRENYEPQIEASATIQQQQQLARQMQIAMVDAIEDSGMGVQRYNEISVYANGNPELREDIMDRIDLKQE